MQRDDVKPGDLPQPETDESGDVDLALVDYCLSLTPAQRLEQLEQFATFILDARRRNRVHAWSDTENSSSD